VYSWCRVNLIGLSQFCNLYFFHSPERC